ncbi:VOC family protein [Sphingomonas sp. LaA6.9]|uniref:VOC family protein n=1 Tax=Sphingomonas sp. LaA6.9 TaxID=2919914 RepID=UPI001F5028B1|nr:VOC family protein [Sphingomonas sp. LaA6.9]MCJ8159017.1 VOC family protein [Sphingomonas sp. LaA6.9]
MSDTKPKPILDLKFLSHGTLEVHDIDKSIEFYERFLGFEFVRTSPISGMVRLGGNHIYVVVQGPKGKPMPYTNHNGIDVATKEDVDRAHALCVEHKEEFQLKAITRPILQHDVYAFYFRDRDANWWEILANPEGGYTQRFERYLKSGPVKDVREMFPGTTDAAK